MSDQVPHPYKTTGKITFLYIFIFKYLYSKLQHKTFCTEWQKTFPDLNLLLISSWRNFDLLKWPILYYTAQKYFIRSIIIIIIIIIITIPVITFTHGMYSYTPQTTPVYTI